MSSNPHLRVMFGKWSSGAVADLFEQWKQDWAAGDRYGIVFEDDRRAYAQLARLMQSEANGHEPYDSVIRDGLNSWDNYRELSR